jgi:hypothetical protein
MSRNISARSLGPSSSEQSELALPLNSKPAPTGLFTRVVGAEGRVNDPLVAHLSSNEIHVMSKINKAWHAFFERDESRVKERLYRYKLFNDLLPGIKEEQLPVNLTCNNPETKKIEWEKTYHSIKQFVFGHEFLKSIGVRASCVGPIPAHLVEKKYLPTHSIVIPANSPLGLTRDGKLTNGPQNPDDPEDPGHYAPLGHRHHRPRQADNAERVRTLEFPNTLFNRDFLAADPLLRIEYPMQSPLEQGSPLISFQTNLEIDVPTGCPLRSVNGVLTEEPGPIEPAVNGKRTVKFLNTPHNWLTLAQPVLKDPAREPGPDNPHVTKYLAGDAKPVNQQVRREIKQETMNKKNWWDILRLPGWTAPTANKKNCWDIVPLPDWIAPTAKLVALGGNYQEQKTEAEILDQHPLTFPQDSIHRILTQIRGNRDPYLDEYSRTSTDVVTPSMEGVLTAYKVETYMVPAAAQAPTDPARVFIGCDFGSNRVGLATAWGPAGSP